MTRKSLIVLSLFTLVSAACGGGGGGGGGPTAPPPPPPAPGGQVVVVQVVDDAYDPKSVTIQPGDTVRWVMRGSNVGHTVTALSGAFNSGFVFNADGDVYERTFTAAENGMTFEYSCATHQACCQMQGSVRVGDNAPVPRPGY